MIHNLLSYLIKNFFPKAELNISIRTWLLLDNIICWCLCDVLPQISTWEVLSSVTDPIRSQPKLGEYSQSKLIIEILNFLPIFVLSIIALEQPAGQDWIK